MKSKYFNLDVIHPHRCIHGEHTAPGQIAHARCNINKGKHPNIRECPYIWSMVDCSSYEKNENYEQEKFKVILKQDERE
jgi:hypothetical protein